MRKKYGNNLESIVYIKAIMVLAILFVQLPKQAQCKSSEKEVRMGVISFSYRSMPDQSLSAILSYVVNSGLNSVELMGEPLEEFAGIPQTDDREAIRQWRVTVSMEKFKEASLKFKKQGVDIGSVKMIRERENWSDEEIDYAFKVCMAMGAKGVSMEASYELAKRVAPFAEKYNLYAIFHNHYQQSDAGFSFDQLLSYGSKLMLNLDVGHYYGSTGQNPVSLIERLHDRIFSLHIKDKTGPNAKTPNTNHEFGKGETPIFEIIDLIQQNNWLIICDIELEYPIPEDSDAVAEVKKCAIYCRELLAKEKNPNN